MLPALSSTTPRSAGDAPLSLALIESAVAAGLVPLPAESAGYLVLGLADQLARAPLPLDERAVLLSPEGNVALLALTTTSRTANASEAVLEGQLRALLGRLVRLAPSAAPALGAVARRAPQSALAPFIREVEAALIPVNRSAGRRALARLQREVDRVRPRIPALRPAPEATAPPAPAPASAPVLRPAAVQAAAQVSVVPAAPAPKPRVAPAAPPASPASAAPRPVEAMAIPSLFPPAAQATEPTIELKPQEFLPDESTEMRAPVELDVPDRAEVLAPVHVEVPDMDPPAPLPTEAVTRPERVAVRPRPEPSPAPVSVAPPDSEVRAASEPPVSARPASVQPASVQMALERLASERPASVRPASVRPASVRPASVRPGRRAEGGAPEPVELEETGEPASARAAGGAASVEELLDRFALSDGLNEREVGRLLKQSVGIELSALPPGVETLAPPVALAPEAWHPAPEVVDVMPSLPPLSPRPPRRPRATLALTAVVLLVGIAATLAVWVKAPWFFGGHLP